MDSMSGMGTGNVEGWDELVRVVKQEFPDVLGECDDDDSEIRAPEIRAMIIGAAMAGENVVWLRDHLGGDPATVMALKRCEAAAREARGG